MLLRRLSPSIAIATTQAPLQRFALMCGLMGRPGRAFMDMSETARLTARARGRRLSMSYPFLAEAEERRHLSPIELHCFLQLAD